MDTVLTIIVDFVCLNAKIHLELEFIKLYLKVKIVYTETFNTAKRMVLGISNLINTLYHIHCNI